MSSTRPRATTTTPTASAAELAWTAQRVTALGATTSLAVAAAILGLSRATAYRLARTGRFPVPVLRAGSQYRVPVAPILAAVFPAAGDTDDRRAPPAGPEAPT